MKSTVRRRLARSARLLLLCPLLAGVGCGTLQSLPHLALPQLALPHLALPHVPTPHVGTPQPNASVAQVESSVTDAAGPVRLATAEHIGAQRSISDSRSVALVACNQCSSTGSGCSACAAPSGACGGMCDPRMVQNCENAQEYIFDGGDLEPGMVLRKDGSVIGIDPTDTVAYYQTEAGTICVRPSNRVPIYAPRFGAVRQVSGVQLSTRAIGATPIIAPLNVVQLDEANLASTMVQPVSPLGQQQVSLIDAFEENYGGKPIAQVIPVERLSKALVPNQNIESQNPRMIMEDETAVLGRILERVEIASLPESVVVLVDGRAASVTRSTLRAQDVYLYEMPDKCSLRLCKSTSHTIVNPGDIVRFTLRFDNVGVKPLSNAVIVDSLSPRLDYIDGSQQCSVETRFSATPNDVGSMVLQWEIADSIDSSEGGVISFDCRVR